MARARARVTVELLSVNTDNVPGDEQNLLAMAERFQQRLEDAVQKGTPLLINSWYPFTLDVSLIED